MNNNSVEIPEKTLVAGWFFLTYNPTYMQETGNPQIYTDIFTQIYLRSIEDKSKSSKECKRDA